MSTEKLIRVKSGWGMLLLEIVLLVVTVFLFIMAGGSMDSEGIPTSALAVVELIGGIVLICAFSLISMGFFTIQPNEARVLVLFGSYKGTVRDEGFHWSNPFYSRSVGVRGAGEKRKNSAAKISLRARTLNGEHLKVNDKKGNPIEIANVTVWHVADTAKAMFDVDDYETYVATQSETALRHVASVYAYDRSDEEEETSVGITLRSNIEEVSEALKKELATRLETAGVIIDDARLTHLAYAPEIAQAMLRRQQAEAVISARGKIVHGAVSMVDMALTELAEKHVVDLDDERKAAMVSNLMVILCSESEAQPVVNAGTLYQ